jgi:exonuclease III
MNSTPNIRTTNNILNNNGQNNFLSTHSLNNNTTASDEQTPSLWKISSLNIKGINDNTKQQLLYNYLETENIDFLLLQETNILELKQPALESHTHKVRSLINEKINIPPAYTFISSHITTTDKILGHGVGIIVKKPWDQHIFKVHKQDGYGLQIKLSFKGKFIINIISAYHPPCPQPTTLPDKSSRHGLRNK